MHGLVAHHPTDRSEGVEMRGTGRFGRKQAEYQTHRHAIGGIKGNRSIQPQKHRNRAGKSWQAGMGNCDAAAKARAPQTLTLLNPFQNRDRIKPVNCCESL